MHKTKGKETLGLPLILVITNMAIAFSVSFYLLVIFGNFILNCQLLHTVEMLANFVFLACSGLLLLTYRNWRNSDFKRRELENVMNSLSVDVLLVVDATGGILMCNSAVEKMFGYTSDEVIGENSSSLLYWGDYRNREPEQGVPADKIRDTFDVADAKGVKKNGDLFSVEVIVSNLKGSAGKVLLLRDVTEREQARELLRLSETNFRNMVSANVDGMIIVGKDATMLLANPAAGLLFARPPEELQGKPFEFALSSEATDVEIIGPGRHKVAAEICSAEIIWQKEKAWLVCLRDVTQRKKADELKNEFIGVVSHELRTPLSIIREGVSLILEGIPGKINEEQARLLSYAHTSANRMTWIANGLLDIARIEAGKMVPEKTSFSFKALVENTAALFEGQVKERNLGLKVELPSGALSVYADKNMIGQVLTNLLGNAVKFTKEGHVVITVKENGADDLECSVTDSGPGIASGDISRIFDKFQQFGRDVQSGDRGAGLGLSIAKSIVEVHKGHIWAISEEGKGTKVSFTLPKGHNGVKVSS